MGKINIHENVGTCTQEQIPRVGGKVSQSTNRADAEADEPRSNWSLVKLFEALNVNNVTAPRWKEDARPQRSPQSCSGSFD